MRFTAVGDMLIQRRMPRYYDGFTELAEFIAQGEARYVNLETTLHREGECFGSAFNGGSYLRADPEVLDDCRAYGFNLMTFCNNHTLDFSYDGLKKTLEAVRRAGFVQAGVGLNLSEAAAPAYLDTPRGRVAIIGVTSSCDVSCIAGEQSRRVPGRPGLNQLRFQQTLVVTPEQLDAVRRIAEETHINAQTEIERAEGYRDAIPEGCFDFGPLHFRVGEAASRETVCHAADLMRVEKAISEAKFQADHILVAVHSHELSGASKENPADFLKEFAHHCIDAGADAIIGHGPHLLRPIELYRGKPIFYSLGDFVLENECAPFAPEDYYQKYALTSDATMYELFRVRSQDFTRGLQTKRIMFETVVPCWEMENGRLIKLELLPVELGFDLPRGSKGRPRIAGDDAILRRLAALSEPYGTRMEIRDNRAHVLI